LKKGSKVEFEFGELQRKNALVTGSRLMPRPPAEKARLVEAVRKAVWPLIEEGRVRPVIDRTFPMAEAAQAHAYMENGRHVGKILLTT
jgi:NADPH2:quinone reductase